MEAGMELVTHNLIQQGAVMQDHDKTVRGLELCLDTIPDQLGTKQLGILNKHISVLAKWISSLKHLRAFQNTLSIVH
jgi:hypothetical protein